MAENPFAPSVRVRRDIRRHLRGAFVLAAAGLALGATLLPRGDELLLIHVRNRDLDEARRVLSDRESSGVSTVSSVVAHGELYLLEGRVDEALSDLETFVAGNPDNAGAWRRLARLYQYAQRLEDQTRALAQVFRLDPSPDLARQLAMLYRWSGEESREADRLRDLDAVGQATADEVLRSVRLHAALGQRDVALRAIEHLSQRAPESFDYPDLELFASLLVDAGRSADLGARLHQFPLVRQRPEVLTQLATTMQRWGWTRQAVQVFPVPTAATPPILLTGRARAAEGTDVAADVLTELQRVAGERPLSDEPFEATVTLAMSLGSYDALTQLFSSSTERPDPKLVGAAIGRALAHGQRAQAQSLVARFGDDGLGDSPVLALDLAVERDDRARADYWILRIDSQPLTDPLEIAAVAQIEARLGRENQAFDRLARLVASGDAPDWAFTDLTTLATTLSRVDEGLQVLAPPSASPVAPERRRAWAQLAARARRTELLSTWVTGASAGSADAAGLQDVYYLVADQGDVSLAAAVASRLYEVRHTADDGVLLALALIAAARPAEALAPLRATGLADPSSRAAYDSALARVLLDGGATGELRAEAAARLRSARAAGEPLEQRRPLVEGLWAAGERSAIAADVAELAAQNLDAWLSALVETATASGATAEAAELIAGADGGLSSIDEHRRTDRVRALLELDAPDVILLPELQRLAFAAGDGWVNIYDERLARAARTAEQIELWKAIGQSAATPPGIRRSAVSKLIELGASETAEGVLEALASNAGPDDADVRQLVFLGGPTAAPHRVDWLIDRVKSAPVDDRAAWIAHVIATGGAARLVAAAPDVPPDAPAALVDAWLEAYRAAGDRAALEAVLLSTLARPDVALATLQHAGRLALAENLPAAAASAFRLVAAQRPDDKEAARWVGTLAFYGRRTTEARSFLTTYESLGGDDAEPLFQLGELALDDRESADARRYYRRALANLSDTSLDPARRTLLANVLVRLDDRDRAIAVFEGLLRETPGADHVRADFASALLHWGDFDRAWAVLEARAPGPAVADASGALRLDLLRLQWLNFTGHYTAALGLIESLETRFPEDVDVRLARASFDEARGRIVASDRLYAAVLRDAPERRDLADFVSSLDRQRSPSAAMEFESRRISDAWSADSTIVSLDGRPSRHVPVTLTAERVQVNASQVLFADGQIAPLMATIERFEAGISGPLAAASTISGAVFGTRSGVGIGVTYAHHDLRGGWKAVAEHGRPFWEFVESAAGDGRKDRLSIRRDWRFRADAAAWAVVDANRYRLASGDSTSTTALTLGVVRTVRRASPTLTLQYGLDREHVRDSSTVTAEDGRVFSPIPLVSREVHVVGAVTQFSVRGLWTVDASGGYTVDRLGGRGSFLAARATALRGARVGLDLWGERRLYSLATTQQALRGGARVTVRFR